MELSESINKIIDRRIGRNGFEGKGHLEVLKHQKAFFDEVGRLVDDYSALRATILSQIKEQKGEYYVMSLEDPTFLDRVELADPSSFILQLQRCKTECERLIKRFNRDTINISVVGRAGQGKSRLLQSISGVPNDIIPADTGGHCTGTKSVIANAKGPMHAVINFYTEQEIVTQVQAYINALGVDLTINNISQVPRININDIRGKLGSMTTAQGSLFRHLSNYVLHFDKYAQNLGTTQNESDPKKIRYYVAQYATGDTKNKYYAYLGVKDVAIFTEFPEVDAGKIMLVDTIGLGDTSLNLEDKMMETLENDSDAAIVVRKADSEREYVRSEDNDFYDYLVRSFGNRDVEKWLFYALNVCETLHNTITGEELYEDFKEKIDDGSLRVALLEKVDCGSPQDVREKLLLPMLDFIAHNLEEIDKTLMASANNQFASAYASYFELCRKVQNVLNDSMKQFTNTGGLFDDLYEQLRLSAELKELNKKYADINETECTQLLDDIRGITQRISYYVPSESEIAEQIAKGDINADFSTVYNHCAHYLRSIISDEFEKVTNETLISLQEQVKHEIFQILRSNDGGKLNVIHLMDADENSSDKDWVETIITEKLSNYPILTGALRYIADYRINMEGLIEYKINKCLAILDPSNGQILSVNWSKIESEEEAAEFIEQTLLNAIGVFANQLFNSLTDILAIPYNSFDTRIRKFREKIIFSKEGQKELRSLYRENCALIWHEEFAREIKRQAAAGDWSKYAEEMTALCKKERFAM